MQLVKLPSGTIVDVDAIGRIGPIKSYEGVKPSCAYIVDGCHEEAIGADALALYAWIDGQVCNREPADSEPHGNVKARYTDEPCSVCKAMHALVDDILSRVSTSLELMNEGVPVKAANTLEAILNDYAPEDSEAAS